MTQRDRDRPVVLRKAHKKLITQRQAAVEFQLTERHVRRLLIRWKEAGDQAVVHGLRGRASNRKLSEEKRSRIVQILSGEVYRGFGPALASEYLAKKHKVRVGREALRQIMMKAGLWPGGGGGWRKFTSGARDAVAGENWCNGTPAHTTGWKGAAKRSI
jgi:transposase